MLSLVLRGLGRILNFLFVDPARPVEVLSACNLVAWSFLLFMQPELLERDTYAGFRNMGATFWVMIMFAVGCCYVATFVSSGGWVSDARIAANIVSGAVWFMVALNFIASNVGTTADINYLIISILCMTSGVFVGWKTTPSTPRA